LIFNRKRDDACTASNFATALQQLIGEFAVDIDSVSTDMIIYYEVLF
jgi:hypothetical protein